MRDDAHLQDWRRMHELLLEQERLFAAKAIEHALGQATAAELDALHQEVRAIRALADAIFEKAFGLCIHRRQD